MINIKKAGKIAGSLPGLLLEADKVAKSFMKGVHGRRKVGTGEAFWQFREWTQGDSSRDVDWRQTAKRDDVFIRQKEWEASQAAYLYRDASASMEFTSSKKTASKKDYAELLMMALSITMLNGGEQVGLLGVDMPLQTGVSSAAKIVNYIPEQDHFNDSGERVPSNSQVVLISDFYFPTEELCKYCKTLAAKKVKGLLVQVYDEAEKTLPYKGKINFIDPENKESHRILPHVEAVRDEYIEKFLKHQNDLEKMASSIGWKFLSFNSKNKPEKALLDMYEQLAVKV